MVPCQLCTGELDAAMAGQRPQTQHTPTHTEMKAHEQLINTLRKGHMHR